MDKRKLYFIALVPDRELREEIRRLKEQMQKRFNAGHALKSPAHITLQMPFKRNETDEIQMDDALRDFAAGESSFVVELNGYGSFAPKVIFIKVVNHQPVHDLHARLKRVLTEKLHFTPAEVMSGFHPHITLATRDLTPDAFKKAWPEVEKKEFKASFDAGSICLLKHNGRQWYILGEYFFGNDE